MFVISFPMNFFFFPLHLTHPYRINFWNEAVDILYEAQLMSIDNSFTAVCNTEQLSSLWYPIKPCLHAVAMYEVLPDADVWANALHI